MMNKNKSNNDDQAPLDEKQGDSDTLAEKQVNEEPGKPVERPLEEMKSGSITEQGGRVCITYGRDKIMNKQVVSIIRELGIDPLVMQGKEHKSKPVAEFFTEYPNIAFVIAILSADDWVYPKNLKPKDALMYADQKVIFHLGFWIGRLGRNCVFALYYDQRNFRCPTEHFDVIYTPLDKNGNWKKELVSRLSASGIEMNTK